MSYTNTWRCSICALNWPYARVYSTCLQCGEECSKLGGEPMSEKKAEKLAAKLRAEHKAEEARTALYREFDKFYEEREVERFRREMDAAKLC